ncbi:MAG TPA: hypothetical protein VGR47_19085 [Terracidiphilus sp.]|nr:hypothetical protein [Terracidiphilus sp.]
MKSAEEFLSNLHRGIPTPTMFTHHNNLPLEIEFAALRGLRLTPLQGLSRFASAPHSQSLYPTADLVQLRCFSAECPGCNWGMVADGTIVVEYNPAVGRHSLCELCDGDYDGWCDTLQFRSGAGPSATRFLLFNHAGQKLRALGPRSGGIRVHCGARFMVPVPPSRFVSGPQLTWWDTSAVIEDIPWFLLEQDGDADWNPPAATPAIPAFAGTPHEPYYVHDDRSL